MQRVIPKVITLMILSMEIINNPILLNSRLIRPNNKLMFRNSRPITNKRLSIPNK